MYSVDHLALSFNGGKDCTALLYLIFAVLHSMDVDYRKLTVIYFNIPDDFPEIIDFMQLIEQKFDFKVLRLDGGYRDGLFKLLDDRKQSGSEIKAIFMGQRRHDPDARNLAVVSRSSPPYPEFDRLNPLLEWTCPQIWGFLRGFGMPYCSLYDQGFTSLGSVASTHPNPYLWRGVDAQGNNIFAPAHELTNDELERSGRCSKDEFVARIDEVKSRIIDKPKVVSSSSSF